MTRNLLLIAIVCTLPAAAQTAAAHVQVELVSGIKTKKAKVGDKVKGKTGSPLILPDGTVVPVTSPVNGVIREVTADSGGKSYVSISFDQVEVYGKKIQVAMFIQAAMMPSGPGKAPEDPSAISPSDVPHDRAMAGRRQTVQDSAQVQSKAPSTPAEPGTPSPSNAYAAHSGSVIGMSGVTLQIDEDGRQPTKFESNAPNLELKPGLQLMLGVLR
jgi:hypothetical protein